MKCKIDRKKFEKCTPPGIDFSKQLKICLVGLSAAFGWSWSFFAKYLTARSNLYTYSLGGKTLRKGAVIADFSTLLHERMDSLDGFLVFYIVMAGLIFYYYLSYYQGSKSIYLMRRLPDRWELYFRCIALPFGAIATGALIEMALVMLYYGIYFVFTPQQCLPFFK